MNYFGTAENARRCCEP